MAKVTLLSDVKKKNGNLKLSNDFEMKENRKTSLILQVCTLLFIHPPPKWALNEIQGFLIPFLETSPTVQLTSLWNSSYTQLLFVKLFILCLVQVFNELTWTSKGRHSTAEENTAHFKNLCDFIFYEGIKYRLTHGFWGSTWDTQGGQLVLGQLVLPKGRRPVGITNSPPRVFHITSKKLSVNQFVAHLRNDPGIVSVAIHFM